MNYRQRKTAEIQALVESGQSCESIVPHVISLIEVISPTFEEGNSREILRSVRDSMMEFGQRINTRPDARRAISLIFLRLSGNYKITPAQVSLAHTTLHEAGIESIGGELGRAVGAMLSDSE